MGIFDDLTKLVGKDIKIDGRDYHVGGGNNDTGLSGWFKQDNGNNLNVHIGMDKIEELRRNNNY